MKIHPLWLNICYETPSKSDIQAPRYGNNPRGFHASNMEYRLTYRDCLGNFY